MSIVPRTALRAFVVTLALGAASSAVAQTAPARSSVPGEMASRTTLARFIQAGVIPISINAVLSEAHRTWNRPEAGELAKLCGLAAPNYAAVIESYQKAQEVAKQAR